MCELRSNRNFKNYFDYICQSDFPFFENRRRYHHHKHEVFFKESESPEFPREHHHHHCHHHPKFQGSSRFGDEIEFPDENPHNHQNQHNHHHQFIEYQSFKPFGECEQFKQFGQFRQFGKCGQFSPFGRQFKLCRYNNHDGKQYGQLQSFNIYRHGKLSSFVQLGRHTQCEFRHHRHNHIQPCGQYQDYHHHEESPFGRQTHYNFHLHKIHHCQKCRSEKYKEHCIHPPFGQFQSFGRFQQFPQCQFHYHNRSHVQQYGLCPGFDEFSYGFHHDHHKSSHHPELRNQTCIKYKSLSPSPGFRKPEKHHHHQQCVKYKSFSKFKHFPPCSFRRSHCERKDESSKSSYSSSSSLYSFSSPRQFEFRKKKWCRYPRRHYAHHHKAHRAHQFGHNW